MPSHCVLGTNPIGLEAHPYDLIEPQFPPKDPISPDTVTLWDGSLNLWGLCYSCLVSGLSCIMGYTAGVRQIHGDRSVGSVGVKEKQKWLFQFIICKMEIRITIPTSLLAVKNK